MAAVVRRDELAVALRLRAAQRGQRFGTRQCRDVRDCWQAPAAVRTNTSSSRTSSSTSSSDVRARKRRAIQELAKLISKASHSHDTIEDDIDMSQFDAARARYDKLMSQLSFAVGNKLSVAEREAKGSVGETSLTYGEMSFDSLAASITKVKRFGALTGAGDTFYDIGSGTGKCVIAAALLHPFESCVGIELLDGLYQASAKLGRLWHSQNGQESRGVRYEQGDLTVNTEWTQATLWLACSTCFDKKLMAQVDACAQASPVGTWAITLTKRLQSPKWTVRDRHTYTMSWGPATVYIYEKTAR